MVVRERIEVVVLGRVLFGFWFFFCFLLVGELIMF